MAPVQRGYFLAVDSATAACTAAVWLDGTLLEKFVVDGRGHTRRLLPMVRELMAEAGRPASQLDGLACGVGPGSFTGVRIGVGLIKGMALALDRPVVAVSSLAAVSLPTLREHPQAAVYVVTDAHMAEVYCAQYRLDDAGNLQCLLDPAVCAPDQIPAASAGRWHAVGNGWERYAEALSAIIQSSSGKRLNDALPHAGDVLSLALPQFERGETISGDALLPTYLREKVALTVEEQQAARAVAGS